MSFRYGIRVNIKLVKSIFQLSIWVSRASLSIHEGAYGELSTLYMSFIFIVSYQLLILYYGFQLSIWVSISNFSLIHLTTPYFQLSIWVSRASQSYQEDPSRFQLSIWVSIEGELRSETIEKFAFNSLYEFLLLLLLLYQYLELLTFNSLYEFLCLLRRYTGPKLSRLSTLYMSFRIYFLLFVVFKSLFFILFLGVGVTIGVSVFHL